MPLHGLIFFALFLIFMWFFTGRACAVEVVERVREARQKQRLLWLNEARLKVLYVICVASGFAGMLFFCCLYLISLGFELFKVLWWVHAEFGYLKTARKVLRFIWCEITNWFKFPIAEVSNGNDGPQS